MQSTRGGCPICVAGERHKVGEGHSVLEGNHEHIQRRTSAFLAAAFFLGAFFLAPKSSSSLSSASLSVFRRALPPCARQLATDLRVHLCTASRT